jgi:hypothetical protein
MFLYWLLFIANLLKVENEANNFHENQLTINNNITKDQTHQQFEGEERLGGNLQK